MFTLFYSVLFVYAELLTAIQLHDPVASSNIQYGAANNQDNRYIYAEEWLHKVPIDHFSYSDNRFFKLRYLLNTDNFVTNGPIFFYAGNEGNIDGFAQNTGLMWDLAPQYNAAVVFAEHRFYGRSQPLGNSSYKSVHNLGYLSSEQALADFSMLVQHLKKRRLLRAQHSPVIVFGGSYGGMLAAWMRIKYPHVVDGAIAASAPVFWFFGTSVMQDTYERIVTRSFAKFGCDVKNVYKSWTALNNIARTAVGRNYLNNLFHLEKKSYMKSADDVHFLLQFIAEVFETMAMVNYPYPTNFMQPLPGWPVKESCTFFNRSDELTDEERAQNLYAIVNLFYNYTGNRDTLCANPSVCNNQSAFAALGSPLGWPWQTCTEMVMQMCASGPPNDFFLKSCPFSISEQANQCNNMFGKIGWTRELLRPNWILLNYGDHYPSASNIVFSNGYLDPWSGGGWSLKSVTVGSLVSIIIEDGAHHYDLRSAHPADTDAVKKARKLEQMHISKWIQQANNRNIKKTKNEQFQLIFLVN